MLSDGLANLNVRIGADRVLRVYHRDQSAAAMEATLLRHPWRSFSVPAVLGSGEDFLVLQYVPHGPLTDDAVRGEAVGRALAEIHGISFSRAGLLSSELTLSTPFPDAVDSLSEYALAKIDSVPRDLSAELRPMLEAFLDAHGDALRRLTRTNVLLHGDFKASNLHWTQRHQLLVLDWEFAYSGPSLLDVGQLIRWRPQPPFLEAFARSYRDKGGALPEDWQRWADGFDLFNLSGLLAGADPASRRATDVLRRIRQTLTAFATVR